MEYFFLINSISKQKREMGITIGKVDRNEQLPAFINIIRHLQKN